MTTPAACDLLAHLDDLQRWARQRTADPHLAEDLVQETMVQALARLPELRDENKLGGWLFRIAERRLIDSYRRARLVELPLLADPAIPAPDDFAREPPRLELLRVAVRRLPPTLRKAVRLHYLEERSVADVAQALGTTISGVKSRLYRARRRMREARL
ncbi:MAG: RNA polymerase sigma factor [Planctomycetota bacterium]|jgi:RNA polymerase sigma-70 factor (ECF subfamily)